MVHFKWNMQKRLGRRIYICKSERGFGHRLCICERTGYSAHNKVKDFRIGDRMDSDHLPLQLELEEEEERRNSSINEEKEEEGKGSKEDR